MKNRSLIQTFVASVFLICSYSALFAQSNSGTLKGKVMDEQTHEGVPFATIVAKQNGLVILGATTDFEGNYCIKPLNAGKYDIEASYVGYTKKAVTNVTIKAGKTTFLDIRLSAGAEMKTVEIVQYKIPLIQKDGSSSGSTITREEISRIPGRSVQSISNNTQGVSGQNNTGIRGGRTDGNFYYIDGMKMPGSSTLPPTKAGELPVIAESLAIAPVYPSNENYTKIVENPFVTPVSEPLSTFSIDVDVASYANARRYINGGYMPPVGAIRTEEMINYFTYEYDQPKTGEAFSIHTEIADCPWNTKNKLVHIGIQGQKIAAEHLPQSNLVFLIDVSGSMQDENKLPLVKKSLALLVNNLRDDDRVAIVIYAGASGLALPSTSCRNRSAILAALDVLHAGGSTAGSEGIKLAYQVAKENFITRGNNRVILLTDGDFNVGVTSNDELERLISKKREDGIFLSVLGYGMGNYKDNKMELLADKGNGNYAYIDNLQEARKVLVKEMGGTLFTIAKDVKIQVEFNPRHVRSYRLIGYENRLLAAEDFNDDTKDAGEVGSGQSVTALYEITTTGDGSAEDLPQIDDLKYQRVAEITSEESENELLTVKVRYKHPQENKSMLIQKPLLNKPVKIGVASENLRFSSAVAGFSLLLIDSRYKGDLTYNKTITQAKLAKGNDPEGYRAEFIKLVELAEELEKTALKQKD